jgi:uncharacterized OB-fold protein
MSGRNAAPKLPEAISNLVKIRHDGCLFLDGGRCRRCGQYSFPPQWRSFCCQDETQPVAQEGRGKIYSYTRVHAAPPFGLPQPYAVGYIDLEESGMRVFGLFAPETIDRLEIGACVQLQVRPLGTTADGEPCLRPVFYLQHSPEVSL